LPCFYAGQLAISALRERFNVCMTEEQVTNYIEGMVLQSYNNWRTRYYDRFQYATSPPFPVFLQSISYYAASL
jgi:phosphatidylinositol 4-kinase